MADLTLPRLEAALPEPRRMRAAVAGACLLMLAACGGKEPEKPKMPAPSASTPEPEASATGDWIVLGENPKWKPIAVLFEAYSKREAVAIANPMLNNLSDPDFLKRPTIAAPKELPQCDPDKDPNCVPKVAKCDPKTDPDCAEAPPLERDPLTSYQLIMLETGVPVPKAVVIDGKGEQYDVVRGDALGNEGGRVTAVLQYKILVSVPGKSRPVEVSIAPPLTPVEQKAEQQNPAL
jgi:hypothetical protein